MTDNLPLRMANGDLADDLAQLTRRTERLAASFSDFHNEVVAGRPTIADQARRLAVEAMEIAMQAARVEAERRTLTYLEHTNSDSREG